MIIMKRCFQFEKSTKNRGNLSIWNMIFSIYDLIPLEIIVKILEGQFEQIEWLPLKDFFFFQPKK